MSVWKKCGTLTFLLLCVAFLIVLFGGLFFIAYSESGNIFSSILIALLLFGWITGVFQRRSDWRSDFWNWVLLAILVVLVLGIFNYLAAFFT